MKLGTRLLFGAVMLAEPAAAQDAIGNAAAGEEHFSRQCVSCHVVEDAAGEVLAGRAARTGPNLYGVVGAPPGSQHDFRYSDSLVAYGEAGATWVEDNLTAFVQDPTGHLREALDDAGARSKMAFRLRDEEEARDIYAFLAQFAAQGAGATAAGAGGEAATDDAAVGEAAQDAAGEPATEAGGGGVAGDIVAGETLYQENCRNCHGPKAGGMASFPKLVGLGAEQIVMRLGQYHAGEQVGPNSALMFDVVADLSEEDMANVAAYIATAFE